MEHTTATRRLPGVPTLLSLAIALGCGTLAMPTLAASTAQAQAYRFEIPAQSLDAALAAFSAVTRVQVLVGAEVTQGLRSPGLSGSYPQDQALAQLLAGTGLSATYIDRDSVTLEKRQGEDTALQLGATMVGGKVLGATTEGSQSYTTGALTIGKGEQKLKDIPQSVSVVTRQRMDDQNMNSLQDAMRQVTGATIKSYNSGSSLNDVYMRGFLVDQVQVDGVSQMTGQGDLMTSFDLAMFDRVEVLRGPSGLYQGAGEPGGTINLVRKRALGQFALSGELSAGSYDHYHSTVDITGPLNSDGSLRGRFVTAYEDNKSFVDYAQNERPMVYGRLEYDVTPDTTLSLGGAYQKNRSTPAFGLPAYASGKLLDVKRSTFVDAKWNELDEHVWESFFEVDHALENGGQFKTSLTYRDAETPTRNFTWSDGAVDPATGASSAVAYSYYTHIKTLGLDSFVTLPVEAFGRTHELTMGAEYQHLDKDFTYGGGEYFDTNVFDPGSINIPKQKYEMDNGNWSKSHQYGLYARTKISATDWLDVILGSRVTWFESDAHNANAFFNNFNSTETSINRKVIPYGALVAKLTPELSAYASYTSVFKPQTDVDAGGQTIAPRKGKQYEIGLKREFYDGRLNGSVALFRIYDENRAELVANNQYYEPQGKIRSQGWETELSGNLTDNWSISTGYAFTLLKSLSGEDTNQGTTITPKHNFNLWTRYEFADGPLKDFSVGGGVRAVSATYYKRDVDFVQGGYSIATAQMGYKFNQNLSATLTANNLFDRTYYERVDSSWGSNFYGEPRNLTFTVRAKY
ncbi:TonB-dependent siderophore receptor [Pseudomonas donghuensis]|uniref:TonB-dependent siderophore receptor n=1 Tax=Pseudomonas donghuensis TaxID=1163398 RepID=UPI0020C48CF7|nr:TonB-dependent receptor [Pseudomonas donghuensis]MCP6693295.1 TonB-dependent receptor [Pseudomonas donghuensis]MDF9891155.1 outer membrane receptor for ferric coprogen and ferric-rhodotorulic acid [Pseudomonas vranovensis]UVL29739.1 TonB-dependent receptor [Pseudomonas donghuensis]